MNYMTNIVMIVNCQLSIRKLIFQTIKIVIDKNR